MKSDNINIEGSFEDHTHVDDDVAIDGAFTDSEIVSMIQDEAVILEESNIACNNKPVASPNKFRIS